MLKSGRKKLLGLDIGSSSVKLVQLGRTGGGWAVTAAAMVNIQHEEKRTTAAGMNGQYAVTQCLRTYGRRADLAVCGVSGPEVIVRDFEFTSVPSADLDGAVFMEAKQVCPFESGEIVVDYHWVPTNKGKIRGYFVAAAQSLVEETIRPAEEAGLNCVLVDADGLALLNCFKELDGRDGVAILNLGSSHATLAIESPDGWPFVRDLPHGGDAIIKAMADDSKVPAHVLTESLFGVDQDGTNHRDSLDRVLDGVASDVSRTLRYYRTLGSSYGVAEVLACGGFALADGFTELLGKRLQMKTVLWNPFDQMTVRLGWGRRGALRRKTVERNGPAMAVATGLAMRSI
jgi:type IV pilus assembly protein PilM